MLGLGRSVVGSEVRIDVRGLGRSVGSEVRIDVRVDARL